MKLLLLLAATARLAAGFPHGPDADDDDEPPKGKAPAPAPPPAAAPQTMMGGHDMSGMMGKGGMMDHMKDGKMDDMMGKGGMDHMKGGMMGGMNMNHPAAAPPSPQTKATTSAPAGCRLIHTDAGYPSDATFLAALPGVFKRPAVAAKGDEGLVHPDFRLRAMSYADVEKAVDFARTHNIRLTVINSGHDFLGRNDAPSGLSLDVSLLGGIRVMEEFTPTADGAPRPQGKANVIVPKAGKQAAVTIGVGLSTQALNDALSPSKLVTVGAAHGACF
jgi:hypothetical protein